MPLGVAEPAGPAAGADEEALRAFVRTLPADVAPRARALAHAWTAAGGALHVGKVTVRLLATPPTGRPFTAGTLHATHPDHGACLELGRVLLLNHGVSAQDWSAWCDELAELAGHGFGRTDKFPTLPLHGLPDPVAARLAQGLRDLGRLAHGQPA